MGERFSRMDIGSKHCLLHANTYMCGADASTGVQMASWETHQLSLLCKPLQRGGNALSYKLAPWGCKCGVLRPPKAPTRS